MADVKPLFRDTPREQYFYFQGFLEGYKAAKAKFNVGEIEDTQLLQIEQNVQRQREQIPPEAPTYYGAR